MPAYASPSGPAWDLAGFQGTSPPRFPVDPSLRNAKRRVPQAPRMRAALGGSSLTPAGHPSRFPVASSPASRPPRPLRASGCLPGSRGGRSLPLPTAPTASPLSRARPRRVWGAGALAGVREGPLPGAGARAWPARVRDERPRRRGPSDGGGGRRAGAVWGRGARRPALPLGSPLFIVPAPLPWLVSFITGWQTRWPRGRLSLKTQICREGRSPDCRAPPPPAPPAAPPPVTSQGDPRALRSGKRPGRPMSPAPHLCPGGRGPRGAAVRAPGPVLERRGGRACARRAPCGRRTRPRGLAGTFHIAPVAISQLSGAAASPRGASAMFPEGRLLPQ